MRRALKSGEPGEVNLAVNRAFRIPKASRALHGKERPGAVRAFASHHDRPVTGFHQSAIEHSQDLLRAADRIAPNPRPRLGDAGHREAHVAAFKPSSHCLARELARLALPRVRELAAADWTAPRHGPAAVRFAMHRFHAIKK